MNTRPATHSGEERETQTPRRPHVPRVQDLVFAANSSLTPGIARLKSAKASVALAIASAGRPIVHRVGVVVKERAEGCGSGGGGGAGEWAGATSREELEAGAT